MTMVLDEETVRSLAREVVTAVAPSELRMFTLQADEYFEDPGSALRFDADGDDMLGIGVGDVLPVVTPIVLAISAEVVSYLTDSVAKAAVDRSAEAVKAAVRRLVRRPAVPGQPVLELPPGTEITVRRVVTEISVKGHLNPETLRMIQEALAGSGEDTRGA